MKTLIIGILAIIALVAETVLTVTSVGLYILFTNEAYPLTHTLINKL
jgi:hypothetical protein